MELLLHKITERQAVITAVGFQNIVLIELIITDYHRYFEVLMNTYKNFNYAPIEGNNKNTSMALHQIAHSAEHLFFLYN